MIRVMKQATFIYSHSNGHKTKRYILGRDWLYKN